jgi:hypothetical protein
VSQVDGAVGVGRCAGGKIRFDVFRRHTLPVGIRQQLGELLNGHPVRIDVLVFAFHDWLRWWVCDTANTPATVALIRLFGIIGRLFCTAKQRQTWPRAGVKRKMRITETLLPSFA